MFDEILQYYMNNISLCCRHENYTCPTIPWLELLSQGWCQILPPPAKMRMRSNGNIECGDGSQITEPARQLPEGLTSNRDITAWACFTKLTACCFKWLIRSQVSLAIYRWPCIYVCVCVRTSVCVCVHMLVCIIMDLPVLSEKHFSLGKPSAETDLHHSSWA